MKGSAAVDYNARVPSDGKLQAETGATVHPAPVRSPWLWLAAAAALAVAVAAVYWPILGVALVGDDYQWIQHARHATHRPALLLADLNSLYRPAITWTLVGEGVLWPSCPAGYRATNLGLAALAAIALAWAACRLGLSRAAAVLSAGLWALSPFSFEPAAWVSARVESLVLISWLVLVSVWPRDGEAWCRWRRVVSATAVLMALVSKETWVVTPLLVVAVDMAQRGHGVRRALRSAAPTALLALVYVACYVVAFPGDKGYFELSSAVVWKLPHMFAAFLYFEPLQPLGFSFRWQGLAATLLVVVGMVWVVRRGVAAGIVGGALLILPTLPTLPVPYLPTRFTSIPYAGFVLLVAALVTAASDHAAARWRGGLGVATAAVACAVLLAGVVTVRADISDVARVGDAHQRLLAEAGAVVGDLERGGLILMVRAEVESPLVEIARNPRGLPKLWVPRPDDPYALVDAAALLEWALADDGLGVRRLEEWRIRAEGASGQVLVHRAGGFEPPRWSADLSGDARRFVAAGARVRLVEFFNLRE